jgi:hypothetical protein
VSRAGWTLVLAAVAVGACAPAWQEKPLQEQILELSRRPAFRSFFAELKTLAREAFRGAREQLGLIRPMREISIVLSAASAPGDPDGCRKRPALAIASSRVAMGGRDVATSIVFCVDRIARDPFDPRSILRHELTHVAVAQELGRLAYALPRWFQEGIAELVSGKAHQRVKATIGGAGLNPLTVVRGLDWLESSDRMHGPNAFRGHYAEGYLHVRFLAMRSGEGALPKLFARLRNGDSLWWAIRHVTGMDRSAFINASDAWVKETIAGLATASGLEALKTAHGIDGLRAFLAQHEGSAYLNWVHLRLARLLLDRKRPREALEETRRVVETNESWEAAWLMHARALFAAGEREATRRAISELLANQELTQRSRAFVDKLVKALEATTKRR